MPINYEGTNILTPEGRAALKNANTQIEEAEGTAINPLTLIGAALLIKTGEYGYKGARALVGKAVDAVADTYHFFEDNIHAIATDPAVNGIKAAEEQVLDGYIKTSIMPGAQNRYGDGLAACSEDTLDLWNGKRKVKNQPKISEHDFNDLKDKVRQNADKIGLKIEPTDEFDAAVNWQKNLFE